MAKVLYLIPEQEFLLDDDISLEDAIELGEAGELDLKYDHLISDIDLQAEFVVEADEDEDEDDSAN